MGTKTSLRGMFNRRLGVPWILKYFLNIFNCLLLTRVQPFESTFVTIRRFGITPKPWQLHAWKHVERLTRGGSKRLDQAQAEGGVATSRSVLFASGSVAFFLGRRVHAANEE